MYLCLDEEPVLATDAVRLVDENVDNDAAVLLLGHPLKIKAEREFRQCCWMALQRPISSF